MGGQDARPSTQEPGEIEPPAAIAAEELPVFQGISGDLSVFEASPATANDAAEHIDLLVEQTALLPAGDAPTDECERVEASSSEFDASAPANFEVDDQAEHVVQSPPALPAPECAAEPRSLQSLQMIADEGAMPVVAPIELGQALPVPFEEQTAGASPVIAAEPADCQAPARPEPAIETACTEASSESAFTETSSELLDVPAAVAVAEDEGPAPVVVIEKTAALNVETAVVTPATVTSSLTPQTCPMVPAIVAAAPEKPSVWSRLTSRSIRRHLLRIAAGFAVGWALKVCFFGG